MRNELESIWKEDFDQFKVACDPGLCFKELRNPTTKLGIIGLRAEISVRDLPNTE
jgi:hypothetical protein